MFHKSGAQKNKSRHTIQTSWPKVFGYLTTTPIGQPQTVVLEAQNVGCLFIYWALLFSFTETNQTCSSMAMPLCTQQGPKTCFAKSGVEASKWPAQNPDLTPTEHLGGELGRCLTLTPSHLSPVPDFTNASNLLKFVLELHSNYQAGMFNIYDSHLLRFPFSEINLEGRQSKLLVYPSFIADRLGCHRWCFWSIAEKRIKSIIKNVETAQPNAAL